jgi:EAL domain-containing protein (putative c-di-GMP-specific phosphodiesterase class I)
METNLRRALGRQEFRLHYQPIVALNTGQVMGFEALIRWYSATSGIVQPQDFIPVAEETGLIIPIGRWVLREACQQMMAWKKNAPDGPALFMSVNISPRQFTQVDLVDQIATVLKETGIDPRLLKLEITESLLIDNVESTAVMMKKLQSMNVRLCIDDFGTGYSSLSTLYQLPIHTLKVDRSFVNRINAAGQHGEIVDTIIMLAHNLGMDVIAEGIENIDQLQSLQKRNCEYGQGYYFSRPVTADAAEALMMDGPPWATILPLPETNK